MGVATMRRILLMAGLLACSSPALPSDAFRTCAVQALSGRWGPIAPWQRKAYQRGLDQGVTVGPRIWLTSYGPWEGRMGQVDARGRRCTDRTLAANALPLGTYVWLENPCQMRQVLDRGARSNDRRARRKGCSWWADLWVHRSRDARTCTTRAAVID